MTPSIVFGNYLKNLSTNFIGKKNSGQIKSSKQIFYENA